VTEWWTYRVRSFVLFSARTYERLIEAYNAELWPLQAVVWLAAVAALAWLARGPSAARDRLVLGGLAAAWSAVAWAFEYRRFAAINWAAGYAAMVFAAQAAALLWLALRSRVALRRGARIDRAGLAIAALGVAYPLLAPATGRPWTLAEVVGFMPAPTAIVTLGCLLRAKPARTPLLVVPIATCAFEGALAWALYGGRP